MSQISHVVCWGFLLFLVGVGSPNLQSPGGNHRRLLTYGVGGRVSSESGSFGIVNFFCFCVDFLRMYLQWCRFCVVFEICVQRCLAHLYETFHMKRF